MFLLQIYGVKVELGSQRQWAIVFARSEATKQSRGCCIIAGIASLRFAKTVVCCLCEKRSDEAISWMLHRRWDCFTRYARSQRRWSVVFARSEATKQSRCYCNITEIASLRSQRQTMDTINNDSDILIFCNYVPRMFR